MTDIQENEISPAEDDDVAVGDARKFKGKYIAAIGRRKRAIAQVRIYKKGSGIFIVNEKPISEYFSVDMAAIAKTPIKFVNLSKDHNVSVRVSGGGPSGQAEAIRLGIARALVMMDEAHKVQMKAKGWLTRDAREVERKKPGLKKARRAPQWAKR